MVAGFTSAVLAADVRSTVRDIPDVSSKNQVETGALAASIDDRGFSVRNAR